jgi:hypothetical protein
VWEHGGRNGKAAKPRCFKNLKMNTVPVICRNNKKNLDDCSCNGRVVKRVYCKNEEGK